MDSLKCSKCQEHKQLACFHKDIRNKTGKRSNCKECDKKATKLWKENNKERIAKYNAEYKLAYNYGLSNEQYLDLIKNQNGCCAICSTHQSELKRKLVVDHDHTTGKVRGLLCSFCNVAIGMFKESEENIMSAISYLRNYR